MEHYMEHSGSMEWSIWSGKILSNPDLSVRTGIDVLLYGYIIEKITSWFANITYRGRYIYGI